MTWIGILAYFGCAVFCLAGVVLWCKDYLFRIWLEPEIKRFYGSRTRILSCIMGAIAGIILSLWSLRVQTPTRDVAHMLPPIKECPPQNKSCNPYDTPENRAILSKKKPSKQQSKKSNGSE